MSYYIVPLVFKLSWFAVPVLALLIGCVFSPVFLGRDKKSEILFLLAIGMGIGAGLPGISVIIDGFFLTLIQSLMINLTTMSMYILSSVLLIIRGENILQSL